MAPLYDEGHSYSEAHNYNEILSPQPFVPPSKEHLLATFESSHVPSSDNGSATDDSQLAARDYEYNSSVSSTRHSSSDIFGREIDVELEHMNSRTSSRSSFSSMPASVLIHPISGVKSMPPMDLHEKMVGYTIEESEASFGDFDDPPRTMRPIRPREAAFRKPSSVRAMQMHTEDEGIRSPGSSGLKRSPYYSPNTSSNKPKAKKEYPLVLLHCNLLAPSLPVPGASEPQNQEIVEEVLPTQYWKRWRRLQEKAGSGVLRDRGVLISHPEDLYDMLEERLLESLELQRARVHQGHFLGHEEAGSGSEGELSDNDESETDGEQGEECLDCGGRVLRTSDTNRKWEIRVFAANGLMRAGAWAAAWKEMEKVDVEVGLWLPSDVRRALEKRMAEARLAAPRQEMQLIPMPVPEPPVTQKIESRRQSVQESTRLFSGVSATAAPLPALMPAPPAPPASLALFPDVRRQEPEHQIALGTLMINYIRVLASDKRNIALVAMSVLVGFLATRAQPHEQLQPIAQYFFNGMEAPFMTGRSNVVGPSVPIAPANVHSSVIDIVPSVTSVAPIATESAIPAPEVIQSSFIEEVSEHVQLAESITEVGAVEKMQQYIPSADVSFHKPLSENTIQSEPQVVEDSQEGLQTPTDQAIDEINTPIYAEAARAVEEFAEDAIEEPTGAPVETQIEQPIEEFIEAPIETAVEETTDTFVEPSLDQPAEEVIEESIVTEETSEEPTEELIETAVEQTDEEPMEEPTVVPIQASIQEPAETAVEEPIKEPTEEPIEEPSKEVIEEPVDEPSEEPTEEPVGTAVEETNEEPDEEPNEDLIGEPIDEASEDLTEDPIETAFVETDEEPIEESTDPIQASIKESDETSLEELSGEHIEESVDLN
ncbi:uncharacterized protein N7483_006548 [Penicillium malachiteum]|uniref:uncharacterized protein n=1 Tax=Penicillium malachiteum TaxID=1324776 RepID=UPI002547C093|nr:uncharacterized protein N7483_006548 [Penicillium malachiteum]KAJ5725191.1 hypothetical protein N7483_006548 [Penicillium malachiteum]